MKTAYVALGKGGEKEGKRKPGQESREERAQILGYLEDMEATQLHGYGPLQLMTGRLNEKVIVSTATNQLTRPLYSL